MAAYTIDDLRTTLDARARESQLPGDLVIRATERGQQLRHTRAVRRNGGLALIITALVVTAGVTLADSNREDLPAPAVPDETTSPFQGSGALQDGDVVLVVAGADDRDARLARGAELRQGGFEAVVAEAAWFSGLPAELQRVVVVPLTARTVEEGITICQSVRSNLGLRACDSSTVQLVVGGPVSRCDQHAPKWPDPGWRRCDDG